MAETPTHYVSALQLPNGINFKDPAHYKGEETFQILKLWRQRQALGQIPFRFAGIILAGGKFGGPDYDIKLFDGLRTPISNHVQTSVVQDPQVLETVSEGEESNDEVQLPLVAWEDACSVQSECAETPEKVRNVSRAGNVRRNVLLSDEDATPPPTSRCRVRGG